MQLNKVELVGGLLSVLCMAVALFLLRVETSVLSTLPSDTQAASALEGTIVMVGNEGDETRARVNAFVEAADSQGNLEKLVVDDVVIGVGDEVVLGDTVSVHYVGRLQSGQEFDNSNKRGTPFTFTVGEGKVIQGWEQGIVGMKKGGQRILVIPPQLAYGATGVGPIPGNATLVFSVELLDVKKQ